jgi:hypothetical protein
MAHVVGHRKRRLGRESVLLGTTVAAVFLGVVSVFIAIQVARSGHGVVLAVGIVLVLGGVIAAGKLLLDHVLVGGLKGRRAEDTQRLGVLLNGLPDTWWVFSEFFLGGSAVEFLAVGPGGAYTVEVYRWLARETGTAFSERVATDLAERCALLEAAISRLSGMGASLRVQPVYVCLEAEGLSLGDLVVHPSVPDLRYVGGVLIAGPQNLLALLRTGEPHFVVRTHSLDADKVPRLARLLQERTAPA